MNEQEKAPKNTNWKTSLMPMLKLKIVKLEDLTIHLRSVDEAGNLYDDNESLDDSGMGVIEWCNIPD